MGSRIRIHLLRAAAGAALLLALAACTTSTEPGPEATPGSPADPTTPEPGEDPGQTSSPSPDPGGPTADPEPPVTDVLLLGDVMLARGVDDGGPPVRPLRFLTPQVRGADIAVANLECTLSANGEPQPYQSPGDTFACPPGTLPGLERMGFDALSLANNHTGDFGDRAFLETLDAFTTSPVQRFGAGRDLRGASRAAIVEHDGVRFGFLGFNAIGETPMATPDRAGVLSVRMPPRTGPLQRQDLRHVTGLVRDLNRQADVVIVLPHWGTQYVFTPDPIQSQVGRALTRAGADLVVGGHPHVVQGIEPIGADADDGLIVHSLGNAIFDMDFEPNAMEGATLTARFEGDELVGIRFGPYRMDPADRFAPRPLTGADADKVLGDICSHSLPAMRVSGRERARPTPTGQCVPAARD